MLKEFQEFAVKGNVIDMAVGVVIGGAFGTIVKSFTDDILMPPLGKLTGDVDFSQLFLNISGTPYSSLAAAEEAGAAIIKYGVFINSVVSFLFIAFAVFLLIKQLNRLKREPPPADPTTKTCDFCKSEIAIAATRCAQCTSELQPA